MPYSGGAADKIGNRYELRWTVRCLTQVLADEALSLRLEPPGSEGEGIEFRVRYSNRVEYHQVKRQVARGPWTVARLRQAGVLQAIKEKVYEPEAHFVFVSTTASEPLRELTDRARATESWQEFSVTSLTEDLSKELNQLAAVWADLSCAEIYPLLRRVTFRTIDEVMLQQNNVNRLTYLVDGPPDVVADVLSQAALDQIHQELHADDIWRILESKSFRRVQWGKDRSVLEKISQLNDSYSRSVTRDLILGEPISRAVSEEVVALLTEDEGHQVVVLTGEAGTGKSTVLSEVARFIEDREWPHLAFRLDTLSPVLSAPELGDNLRHLPGSPVHVLASVADGRDCLLIIDQVDSVSAASGRHPQTFECIDELLIQARAIPNMRVLLACRTFDLNNDSRLRQMADKGDGLGTVSVSRLEEATIRDVLNRADLDPDRLSQRQLGLLSLPLNLRLLIESRVVHGNHPQFRTSKDLFDAFWDAKRQAIELRSSSTDDQWFAVMNTMCLQMSSTQFLSVRRETLDKFRPTFVGALVSEHVLVFDNDRYSFFHQSFFDYVYARNFVASGEEIENLVLGNEQVLFRRAQVRQILVYERDADRDRYLADLQFLLTDSRVRPHLRQVVVAFLAALDDPGVDEWQLVAERVRNRETSAEWGIWRTWFHSPAWFRLLNEISELRGWLESGDSWLRAQAVTLLGNVAESEGDRIAELLNPFIGASPEWNSAILYVLRPGDLAHSRCLFGLFLEAIDKGLFDAAEREHPNAISTPDLVRGLTDDKPGWACEAIGHYLGRQLVISGQADHPANDGVFLPPHPYNGDVLVESAQRAPKMFATQVLPCLLQTMEPRQSHPEQRFPQDSIWSHVLRIGDGHSTDGALWKAMTVALSSVARRDPELFVDHAIELQACGFEPAIYLLLKCFAANGEYFAGMAGRFILENPQSLQVGGSPWLAREVLNSIAPHCSEDILNDLEQLILAHYTPWEKCKEGHLQFGLAQFILLSGIPEPLRSERASKRYRELKRKFQRDPIPPESMSDELGFVESPIPSDACSKMTDRQWLSAISRYHGGNVSGWINSLPIGGALELSRALEVEVAKDPVRFVALLKRFPSDTNRFYFDAVLRGIAESDASRESELMDAIKKCHDLPDRPCGRSIAWLVRKKARVLPVEVCDVISWYALRDPDPAQDGRLELPNEPESDPRALVTWGLNTVRGSSADAISALLSAHPDYVTTLVPTIGEMTIDPVIGVRAWVATCLLELLRTIPDHAVELFAKLCETNDELLSTRYVERFVIYATRTHTSQLRPVMERMLTSEIPQVRRGGARIACSAALVSSDDSNLADFCLKGDDSLRFGAAEVFAAYLGNERFRAFCESALIQLFSDDSEEVRTAASSCFLRVPGDALAEITDTVRAFIDSPAFRDGYAELLRAAHDSVACPPEIAVEVCERYLDLVGNASGDISSSAGGAGHRVASLILRSYSQTNVDALIRRCLDLVDRMTQYATFGIDKELDAFER